MGKTKISWASYTNNIVTGCSKPAAIPEAGQEIYRSMGIPFDEKWTRPGTSPECIRCYAEELSLRRKWSLVPWSEDNADDNVKLKLERCVEFRRVKVLPTHLPPSQRERFFVCSMGDIFHRNVPDAFLMSAWEWLLNYQHIYMLLTKRPDRAATFDADWLPHIWLGTTCGHPSTKWRIEALRRSRAQVRFISMEPLLASMMPLELSGIDQVIVGGESGNGFRPMKMEWVREVRDACEKQGVAFFFKQDAAYQTERRPWLVEANGDTKEYKQFPGEMTPARLITSHEATLNILG